MSCYGDFATYSCRGRSTIANSMGHKGPATSMSSARLDFILLAGYASSDTRQMNCPCLNNVGDCDRINSPPSPPNADGLAGAPYDLPIVNYNSNYSKCDYYYTYSSFFARVYFPSPLENRSNSIRPSFLFLLVSFFIQSTYLLYPQIDMVQYGSFPHGEFP